MCPLPTHCHCPVAEMRSMEPTDPNLKGISAKGNGRLEIIIESPFFSLLFFAFFLSFFSYSYAGRSFTREHLEARDKKKRRHRRELNGASAFHLLGTTRSIPPHFLH